jgi:hypothetical protein
LTHRGLAEAGARDDGSDLREFVSCGVLARGFAHLLRGAAKLDPRIEAWSETWSWEPHATTTRKQGADDGGNSLSYLSDP